MRGVFSAILTGLKEMFIGIGILTSAYICVNVAKVIIDIVMK